MSKKKAKKKAKKNGQAKPTPKPVAPPQQVVVNQNQMPLALPL
jgi:hypothetical protein